MYKDIVEFAELEKFMDQKLKNYSSGMQVRLAFSMAIRSQADILLIDEVLAVGDADFQRKCFEYFKMLKKDKKTVVFVSHDMGAVREFCDRALLIDDSKIMDIGDTVKIASEYSKLFIEEIPEENEEDSIEVDAEGKRWGNGKIKIKNIKTSISRDELIVNVSTEVSKDLDGVMYGLHITAQDGREVTAMNNRMINQPDLKHLKPGAKVNFVWKMLNIFNDGKYFITLTLVDDAGIAFDWYADAASFIVKRPDRSTTPVLPPVEVEYKISGSRDE
jgi:ABC-2 type transport system ATP-binding protein